MHKTTHTNGRLVIACSAIITLLSSQALSEDSTPVGKVDCAQLVDTNINDANATAIRLSCYNRRLDNLTEALSSLILERQRLNSTITPITTHNDAVDTITQQQNTIAQLRNERAELQTQLHRLLSDRQPKQLTKEADERLFKNYSEAYTELDNENAELRKLLAELQTSTKKLESLGEEKATRIQQIDQKLSALEVTNADLSARKSQLNEEIKVAEKQTTRLEKQLGENAALQQQQKEQITALLTLKDEQIGSIDILNQKLALDEEQYSSEISKLNDHTKKLSSKIQTLQTELDQIRNQTKQAALNSIATLGTRDREIVKLDDKIKMLMANRDQIAQKFATTKASLEASNDSLTSELVMARDNASSLETENTKLNNKIISNNLSLEQLKSDSIKAQNQLLEQEQQITSLKSELHRARSETEELMAGKSNADASNTDLTNKVANLSTQLNSIQNERDRLAAEVRVARPELQKLNKSIATASADNDALIKQITTKETDLKKANTEISILNDKLNQSQNRYVSAADKITKLSNTATNLESILNESLANNKHIETSLADIKNDLRASQDRFDAKQLELKTLMAEKTALIDAQNALARESQKLAEYIKKQLAGDGLDTVRVGILEDHTITVQVNSNQLFRTGSSKLSTDGQTILAGLGSAISPIDTRRILIEGHSDNVPVGAKLAAIFKDNAGLSMARAVTTAAFFTSNNKIAANNISVSGAGASKPLASNDTAEGRQKNRRVDILLLPVKNAPVKTN